MMLFALLLSATSSFAQDIVPWKQTSQVMIPALEQSNLRPIDLQLVVEKGSRWDNAKTLESTLRKASGIISKCGVVIGEVDVRTVEFDPRITKVFYPTSAYKVDMIPLMKGELSQVRPLGFLFGKSAPATIAKAYNLGMIKRYDNSPGFESYRPVLNTFYISENWVDNAKVLGKKAASYNTFAHELVHLIGDLLHTKDTPNLMTEAENGVQSGDLNAEQCAAITKWPQQG